MCFCISGVPWSCVLRVLFLFFGNTGAHQNAVDKGLTLDINVEESRSIVFEPGVTKTLFDSNWAGEVRVVAGVSFGIGNLLLLMLVLVLVFMMWCI